MKKIITILLFTPLLLVGWWVNSQAQTTSSPSVFPSAGGYITGAGTDFSWTIGEPVHTTFSNAGNMVSQGLEQPEIQIYTGSVNLYLCVGGNVAVPFTSYGIIGASNVYTAQLSNASGSFNTPVNIGSVTGNSSGIINAVIPGLTPIGSGYRIRVVSSLPVFNGKDNGANITINPSCINTWQGDVTGDETNWHNPGNWSNNVVPATCADDATVPSGTVYPVITINVPLGNLNIGDNMQIVLNAQLNICGDITAGTGLGSAFTGTSFVQFVGSTPQNITGKLTANHAVINNATGVALQSGFFNIFTELTLQNGELNTTAGTLRLLSTSANHCAIINDFGTNAGTLNGNIIAQRFVAGTVINQQHQIGIPVQANLSALGAGVSSGYFIPTVDCNELQQGAGTPTGKVYQWHEERPNSIPALDCILDGWEVKSGSTPADKGRGYSVKINPNTTLNVTGVPNLRNTTVAVSNLGNQGYNLPTLQSSPNYTFDAGWHLLTNPYPSGYVYQQEPGFNALAFVYVPTGAFTGSYQPLNPGDVLAPFQGFQVQRTAAGNATFNFHNIQRSTNGNSLFYQNNNSQTLNIEISGNGFMDASVLSFNANSTNTFDADYDLRKQRSDLGQPTLFTGNHSFPYAVNNLKSIAQTSTVDMGVIPGAAGTYTITINGVNSFDPTSYIYLEDKTTGTWQNVRDNNTYTFSMSTTESVDRFVLHFTPAAQLSTTNSSCAGEGQLNIEQPGTATWSYTVVNSNATAVASGTLNQSNSIHISAPAGVYTVTLTDNNNYTVVKQLQVTGPTAITAQGSSAKQLVEVDEEIEFNCTNTDAVSVIWNMGDGNIYYSPVATHQYQQEGTYTVTLTVTNTDGCTHTKTQIITVTPHLANSIINHQLSVIHVFSNANTVYVDFTKLKTVDAAIEIYNVLGQQLANERFSTSTVYTKTLKQLSAAYVIVRVKQGDEILTKKLFLQKD